MFWQKAVAGRISGQGLKAWRGYGVSRGRMTIDCTVNDVPIGAEVSPGPAGLAPDLTATNVVDLVDMVLVPGFIDLHTHGGDGIDVNAGTTDLARIGTFFACHGPPAGGAAS